MPRDLVPPVERAALRAHVQQALSRYWPRNAGALERVARVERPFPDLNLPLRLCEVPLPEWASAFGIDGVLLVPCEACDETSEWSRVDWWLGLFLLLEAWHERTWERHHGVIHSYSFRLRGWDARVWERAWVNRIALFLREWAARELHTDTDSLFGARPLHEIALTHDVDAVGKTTAIRLKQGAFMALNALRLLAQGRPRDAAVRAGQALRFAFGTEIWAVPDAMLELERNAGLRSQFNYYADSRAKNVERWLFDPGYDVTNPEVCGRFPALIDGGWLIGLHASYDTWHSADALRVQRERLQSVVPVPVRSCRQHWLRFSWCDTWSAQGAAGIAADATLMFNDRPGLRAAAALAWHPWNPSTQRAHPVSALPTVLMDSHVYDYRPMTAEQRQRAFRHWIDEVRAVGGQAAILWHPHTITRDYGWRDGFVELIGALATT